MRVKWKKAWIQNQRVCYWLVVILFLLSGLWSCMRQGVYISENWDQSFYFLENSGEQVADLLRMAYGNTDKNNRYAPLLLLVCILTVVAYISLFYARSLFEWQKKWQFDIKNAENLEPSDWFFVKNKTVGVGFLLLAFWLWLVVMGIWQGNG